MALEIGEERVGALCVLALGGRLDTDTSADLELAIQDLLQAGQREYLLDLTKVGYVSSAGLRVLLMLGKAVETGGSLRLCGLNAGVRQIFDVAGFTRLFAIDANRAAALANAPAARREAASAAEAAPSPPAEPAAPPPPPPAAAPAPPPAAAPPAPVAPPAPAVAAPAVEAPASPTREDDTRLRLVARLLGVDETPPPRISLGSGRAAAVAAALGQTPAAR